MDHSEAHIMDTNNNDGLITTLCNEHVSRERFAGEGPDGTVLGLHRSSTSESAKNERKSHETHDYYKTIAATVRVYDDVFVFGPTTAPREFTNYLREQPMFSDKHIVTEASDYITKPQMLERVRKHYHM
jgi:hypothetical protein